MKNKVKWITAVVLLVVIAGIYSIVDKTANIYNSDVDNSEYQAVELAQGDSISQPFVTKEKALDGMELKLSAVGETEKIHICYEIQDETGRVLVQKKSSLEDLKNGKFYEVEFEKLEGCQGKKCVFRMKVDTCGEDQGVIVYATKGSENGNALVKNGDEMDCTLVLRTIAHRFDIETFVITMVFLLYVVLFLKWLGKLFK